MRLTLVALTLLALTACGGSDGGDRPIDEQTSEATKAEPKTLNAAKDLAKKEADAFAAQDYGGAWDLWTAAAKAALSRDDYVAFSKACDFGGIPLEVKDIRAEGTDKAVVKIGLDTFLTAYTLAYENGQWRWIPNALDEYDGATVDELVTSAKADGSCNAE